MSALFYCLTILIVIINGQFDDCGTQSITVGTNANERTLTIQLERDLTASEIRITLTGPTDKWYGFVIGQGTMNNGYGVYGSGTDTNFVVTEQFLQKYGGGSALASSDTDTPTVTWDDTSGIATIVLTRPFSVSGNGYYDFTSLFGAQCTGDDMDFGGVIGETNTYEKHEFETPNQVFTSSCSCPTDDPTTTTYETTADPSSDPTTEPTMDGTTTTAGDTTTPDFSTTPMSTLPFTSTEDDGYELCAMKDLLDTKLYVLRNTDEQMVKIVMNGSNSAWFGYGFGSAEMTGSYAVTVEADNSADLLGLIRERTLDRESPPGTLLDASGSARVINIDSYAMAEFVRAYAVTNDGFDFTEFLKCNEDSIDLIAAIGDSADADSGTKMGYHASRVDAETLTRLATCICDTDTDDMTTGSPGDGSSANNIFKGFNTMAIVIACIYLIMT